MSTRAIRCPAKNDSTTLLHLSPSSCKPRLRCLLGLRARLRKHAEDIRRLLSCNRDQEEDLRLRGEFVQLEAQKIFSDRLAGTRVLQRKLRIRNVEPAGAVRLLVIAECREE